jgi:RimJ/RimL family protein N-acetyltransferase
MIGHIIYEEHRDGHEIIVRYPTIEDAQILMDYINRLSAEQTFILMQGEQKTLKEETEFLQEKIDHIEAGRAVFLLLFIDGTLAGVSGIDQKGLALSPQGDFGISLADAYRGKGYGRRLMQCTCSEAEARLPISLIILTLFSNNTSALHLYESEGFIECGRIPNAILHRGELVDEIVMYRPVHRST